MVTYQFERFNHVLGRCDWHLFPVEMRRIFVIILANAQQPTFIRGYGNILCAREALKRVNEKKNSVGEIHLNFQLTSFSKQTIKRGFSYFMTLHRING